MAETGVSAAEHAALTQRVTGIEGAVRSIREDIHGLVTKFDERSRMPWGTLIAAATFFWFVITSFVTIGGGVVAWGLLSQTEHIVTSLNEFKRSYENTRIIDREDISSRFNTVSGSLDRTVPREELTRVWSAYDQRFIDHQRQIDENKTALGSTYSLRDYIGRLTERIDTLESRVLSQDGSR